MPVENNERHMTVYFWENAYASHIWFCFSGIYQSKAFESIIVTDEFTKILLLSETHRRPTCMIGDPSETDMFHQIPTYLIVDPSETNMLHRRPIWNRHAPLENDMPDR